MPSKRKRTASWILALPSVLALACAEGEGGIPTYPIVAETAWVTVRAEDGVFSHFCEGDRLGLDALADDVATTLQIPLDERLDASIVGWETLQEHCGGADGCYRTRSRRILASPFGLSHEIVHGVVHQEFETPPQFLDEGLAFAYDAPAPRGGRSIANVILSDEYPRDKTEAHFARWLLAQEHGPAMVRRLLDGEDAEDALGMSLIELEQVYVATSPELYELDGFCGGPEVPGSSHQERDETLRIDCNAPETVSLMARGLAGFPTVRRTLTIDEPGMYSILVTGPGAWRATLAGCPRVTDPLPDVASYDHTVYVGMFSGVAGEILQPGQPRLLDLAAMRHRMEISTASDGEEITVEVRRVAE